MLWQWAYMLRGWSDEQGSKNWRGLWIEDCAAASAKGEGPKLNAGGLRVLLISLRWSLRSVCPSDQLTDRMRATHPCEVEFSVLIITYSHLLVTVSLYGYYPASNSLFHYGRAY